MSHSKLALTFLAGLLLALTFWLYWPGHAGPSLLDDRSSLYKIVEAEANPEFALDYIFGDRSGLLGRSVTMATFVLEKLAFNGDIHTSKKVNIVLHLFTGSLVFWLLALLLRRTAIVGSTQFALILAAFWLLAPLHVSTVLYAVQRMAMMSTLFMLLACISYCYWRQSLSRGVINFYAAFATLSFIFLGLFSKENAIVVVPIILSMEALWFQFRDDQEKLISWLRSSTLLLIVLGALALLLFVAFNYDSMAMKFARRPFTLEERVLTQTRILWDYIGQFYFPDLTRLGIYHDDVVISTSILEPVSTLYSLIAWATAIGLAGILLLWQWGRLLAFTLAWYLLGHAVESSVLSLELYFEHRNYFSSVGLVLFVGVLAAGLVAKMPQIRPPLLVYLICWAFWMALQTSSQVQVWSSRVLLSFNHYNGHPTSYRAISDMATMMASLGDLELARRYSSEAYENSVGELRGDVGLRDITLSCIANRPVPPGWIARLGDDNPTRPFSSGSTFVMLARLLQENECPNFDRLLLADKLREIYLSEGSVARAKPAIFLSLALLENALLRYDHANEYIDKYLERFPHESRALLMKLHFASGQGDSEQVAEQVERLRGLDQQGKLTIREQQTLQLYLEQ